MRKVAYGDLGVEEITEKTPRYTTSMMSRRDYLVLKDLMWVSSGTRYEGKKHQQKNHLHLVSALCTLMPYL